MGEAIQQIKSQLDEYWQSIDNDKKKRIIIIGIMALLSIIILTVLLTRTRYEVLYRNLSLEDMGEVKNKLDELGIDYKIANDDPTTILVPKDMKNIAKIELASEGLPQSGYSFLDAFNDSSWTMTDYDKKERMKFALQSELASTIAGIDGIKKATVYINEKDESGFVLNEFENETTASVFIEKSGRRSLSGQTIEAIQNLVASSVNMDPEKVQIIDNEGNLLTGDQSEAEILLTDQFLIRSSLESKINESIKKFLENIFGSGNVDVRSSVNINFDSEKTTIVEFQPPIEGNEEGLIRSIEEVEEHITDVQASGRPGTDANIPDYIMEDEDREAYYKRNSIINYELNEINQEILRAPGQVEDITVAVLINRQVLLDEEFNEDIRRDIENLIYAATGLDTRQVEVMASDFVVQETADVLPIDDDRNLYWYVGLGILAILVILGLIIYRRRKIEREQLEDLQLRMAEERAITEEVEELDLEIEKPKLKIQIDNFVEKNPELAAQLIRAWLNE
ncbi:MAG: flagellar M-ring protein FliF [Tissierellia bacterium]|nr:flagellar M-ring protein FliF [Tissierellia bacterium]